MGIVNNTYNKTIELLRPFVFMALGALMHWSYSMYQQSESNNELLHNDSKHEQTINAETMELKDEIDEYLRNNDPYDANGQPTPEWLRLLQRQREIARERGDQRSILRKATNLFTP